MKSTIKIGFLLILGMAASANANVVDIWECTINDGKTMDDVRAANAKWSEYINANVEGEEIASYIMTPIVGTRGVFMYADSFPTLASWTAADALESEELTAITQELGEVATCSKNSLYRSEKS